MSYSKPIMSPCLSVCAVSGKAGVCVGCGRRLKEIAGWSGMSDAERRAIMEELPARIEALGAQATAPQEALARIEAALSR
ncbi:MAG: DUF1289 domain-containing protein [Rhizobiales bacterium]|nr:DUF1289 domain-containing protein [Hyphomicrobiales bacterium]